MNDTNAGEISNGELVWSYVYLGITMAIGIPGNALILLVVSSVHLKNDIDNYILSLAANDLAFCCLCVPADIMLFTGYLESLNSTSVANIFCKTKTYIRSVLSSTESLIICLIALHRYYRVVRPQRKFFLSSNSKAGSIGCLFVAVFIAVPNVIIEWDAAELQCRQGEKVFIKLYIMFHCVLSLFVAGTITFSYICIAMAIHRAAKVVNEQPRNIVRTGDDFTNGTQNPIAQFQMDANVENNFEKQHQLLRTTFALFICSFIYVLSWLPCWIQYILYAATSYRNPSLDFLLTRSYHVNAFANAIVYVICNPSFRKKTLNICCGWYYSRYLGIRRDTMNS